MCEINERLIDNGTVRVALLSLRNDGEYERDELMAAFEAAIRISRYLSGELVRLEQAGVWS